MRKLVLLFLTINIYTFALGQEARFSVEVSTDSILLGNFIEVKFILENAKAGNFTPPEFEDFQVVGGPNHASSYSMINGETTQSTTISYYLEPKDVDRLKAAARELLSASAEFQRLVSDLQ